MPQCTSAILLLSGDGWTVPVAGAVFSAVVACVLPIREGKPLVSLKNSPTHGIRALHPFRPDDADASESDDDGHADSFFADQNPGHESDCSWEIVSGGTASPPAEEPNESLGFRMVAEVSMVDPQIPDHQCHDCVHCDDKICGGTCLVSWRVAGGIYNVHSACCAAWSKGVGDAGEMMSALVDSQETAPMRLHSIINVILNEMFAKRPENPFGVDNLEEAPETPRPVPISVPETISSQDL